MPEQTTLEKADGLDAWAYVPRAMDSCRALASDPAQAFRLTDRWNTVAVVTDGSSVPGLGDIGPLASLPLVEEKGRLLAKLAEISAIPLVLDSRALDDAVTTITTLSPSFGAVNLEAMTEQASMEIKRRLSELDELPVFHDTQDGLPVLCLAALLNALKVVGKKMGGIRLVIASNENEALPMVDFLRLAGAADIVVCDRSGAIHRGRPGATNWIKEELAQKTNPRQAKGSLAKVLPGSDVLVILSQGGPPVRDLAGPMSPPAVIFNLTGQNVDYGQAAIVADPRAGQANQLSSCLVFPGLLKGVLNARARAINAPMKMAAALALSKLVPEAELGPGFIVPSVGKPNLVSAMAEAVSAAAAASGVSRFL
ncbi:MAG: NAD-dependent malic enzyme [Deltaproteobacteria bacterium]|jgi:malate dehydrogenase (oxaloacetate-decarboxylating)|nr:NAD-dependent malic enzyme [Deltaproteobacteria bacterium]